MTWRFKIGLEKNDFFYNNLEVFTATLNVINLEDI